MKNRKVYISQVPVARKRDGFLPDLSSCDKFGETIYIFDAEDKPFADPGLAAEKARRALVDYDPDLDYLCLPHNTDPTGHAIIIAVVAAMSDKINLLHWQRSGGYTPILLRHFK